MSIREDVEKLESKANKLETSFALEMLHDYKIQNKRLFIIVVMMMLLWFATGSYLVYILNDIGTTEETQSIEDIDTIENSSISNGGNNG